MPILDYRCAGCGVETHIHFDPNDTMLTVGRKLEEGHKKWSPDCAVHLLIVRLYTDYIQETGAGSGEISHP